MGIKYRNGEYYPAHFMTVTQHDLEVKKLDTKWEETFDWRVYLRKEFDTRKLLIISNDTIQGLISLQSQEGWVQVELVENAPQNRGPKREFFDHMLVNEVLTWDLMAMCHFALKPH